MVHFAETGKLANVKAFVVYFCIGVLDESIIYLSPGSNETSWCMPSSQGENMSWVVDRKL
jgi:hypothetical protein